MASNGANNYHSRQCVESNFNKIYAQNYSWKILISHFVDISSWISLLIHLTGRLSVEMLILCSLFSHQKVFQFPNRHLNVERTAEFKTLWMVNRLRSKKNHSELSLEYLKMLLPLLVLVIAAQWYINLYMCKNAEAFETATHVVLVMAIVTASNHSYACW